jgi:hypothetical protein
MVKGSIAELKVATATVLGHTPVVASGGPTEMTLGGPGWHTVLPVVKFHTALDAMASPDPSLAPVVMVATYWVLRARVAAGVKIAVLLPES